MATYGYSNRVRGTGGSYNNNDKHRSGGGSFHRTVNTLTRLGGSSKGVGGHHQGGGNIGSGSAIPPRNVPKPIQTCSLKKENGGQDVTAVLVNRNNGSGKRIGWGSALPPSNSTTNAPATVPSTTTDVERTETPTNDAKPKNRSKANGQEHHYPPLPPTADESDAKNVPWAMHPPADNTNGAAPNSDLTTDDKKRGDMSSSPPPQQQHPQHQQEKGERSYPHERYSREYHHHPPPHYQREYVPHHDRRYHRSHPGVPYNNHDGYDREDRYYSNDRYYRRTDHPRPYSRDRGDYREYHRPRYDPRDRPPPPEYMHREHRPRHNNNMSTEKEPTAGSMPTFDARNHAPNSYYQSEDRRWGDDEDDDSFTNKKNEPSSSVAPGHHHPNHEQQQHRIYDDINQNDHGSHHDHRYVACYRDIPRRHSQDLDRDKMERDQGYRNRNYDMPPRSYPNYGPRRNYDPQRLNYEYVNPDERRQQDPYHHMHNMQQPNPNSYHRQQYQHPAQNEEEVVMQAIRERDAAEARAKQKDIEQQQRYRYDKKAQQTTTETPVVPSGPIIILRNKQTSGEASSDVANSAEQSRQEHATTSESNVKNEKVIAERKHDDGQKDDKQQNSTNDKGSVANESTKLPGNDRQQETPKISTTNTSKKNSNENPTTNRVKESYTNATAEMGTKLSEEVSDKDQTCTEPERHDSSSKLTEINVEYKKAESNVSAASESAEDTDSKPSPVPINAKDRKTFEQQNVLRRVAAHRESSKKKLKSTTFKKKLVKPQKENDTDASDSVEPPEQSTQTSSKDADSSKSKEKDENKTDSVTEKTLTEDKVAPLNGLKKWGPRTKGVLFRRQADGTLVNADLSEEEIVRREERRKAKIARELAKEEKRNERLKAKEEKSKAREARRQQLKEAKRKDKEDSISKRKFNSNNRKQHKEKCVYGETKSEGTIPKAVNFKSQHFIPAPTPAVSAWEAGPPRSVLEASIPVPTEVPLKSSNDMVIEDITSDSEAAGSCASNNARLQTQNTPFKSDDDINNTVLKKFPTPQHEDEASWNQSKDINADGKDIKFSPTMNPIGLPLTTNVATWNAFGASNLFAPPQENGSAHAGTSWGLTNDASPTLPTNEEDDTAALTDASAAVPRDLLSSGPASEEEEARKEDTKDSKSNKEKFNKRRPERYHKPRPGRHARTRKNYKPYRRGQPNNEDSAAAPESAESKEEMDDKHRSTRPKYFKRRYHHKDNNRSRPNKAIGDRSSKDEDVENRVRRPYNPHRRKYKPRPSQNNNPTPAVEASN